MSGMPATTPQALRLAPARASRALAWSMLCHSTPSRQTPGSPMAAAGNPAARCKLCAQGRGASPSLLQAAGPAWRSRRRRAHRRYVCWTPQGRQARSDAGDRDNRVDQRCVVSPDRRARTQIASAHSGVPVRSASGQPARRSATRHRWARSAEQIETAVRVHAASIPGDSRHVRAVVPGHGSSAQAMASRRFPTALAEQSGGLVL